MLSLFLCVGEGVFYECQLDPSTYILCFALPQTPFRSALGYSSGVRTLVSLKNGPLPTN